jgi:transcriptional regulator with XRE-family HTH domain
LCPAILLVVFLLVPAYLLGVIDVTTFFRALGKRVRSLREAKGLIQEDMISFGFSARHWQQIEKGRPINATTLLRITLALNCPLHRLVRGLPKPILVNPQQPK